MASQSWVAATHPPVLNYGNQTIYGSLGGVQDGENQAHSQVDVPTGTFSNLYLSLNANGGTITAHFNVGNANVNQAISATGGTTGFFQDTTHSDTTTSGNKGCVQFVGPATGLFEAGSYGMLLDTTSGAAKATHWIGQGSQSSGNNTGGYFGSGPRTQTTESSAEVVSQSAGTLSNMQAWSTNGFQTFTSRVAGAAGAQSVTPGSGLWAEDSTHSDSVSIGNKIGYGVNTTSTDRTYNALLRFTSSDGGYDKIGSTVTVNGTSFANFNTAQNSGTETSYQELAVYQCKMTDLGVFNDTSLGNGGNGTATIRKNAVSGSNTVSWTGNVTGWYQDTTHSDTFNVADKYGMQMAPLSAVNLTMTTVHIAPGVSTESGAVTMALGGVAFSIAASDPTFVNKHVTMALSGVSFSLSAARVESLAGSFVLRGVSFNAAAHRVETANVTMSLNGVTIAAFATDLTAVQKLRQFQTFG